MKNTITLLIATTLLLKFVFAQNLIQDVNTTSSEQSSSPGEFRPFKNGFLFSASTLENGRELWWSDGTPNGAQLLKDIFPGGNSGLGESTLEHAVAIGDTLFFFANGGEWGKQLWRTDGTEVGTYRVSAFQDIANRFTVPLATFNNEIYFAFLKPGTDYKQIWKGNGQEGNFQLVKDSIVSWSEITSLNQVGSLLYFSTNASSGDRWLWRTDGTPQGTYSILHKPFGGYSHFIEYQNQTFLVVKSNNLRHLYETDGTIAGTQQVVEFNLSSGSIRSGNSQVVNGNMYFSFYTDEDFYLFKSDGTESGTSSIVDLDGTNYLIPSSMKASNQYLYFSAPLNSGTGLYRYDTQSSQLESIVHLSALDGVMAGNVFGSIDFAENTNGILGVYTPQAIILTPTFSGISPQFWRTDGTTAGTFDLGLDEVSSSIISVGNNFFFGAKKSTADVEVYVSDGTVAGTGLYANLDSSISSVGRDPRKFTLNNEVFVNIDDGVHGTEFWKTDGTSQGTYLLKDIDSVGSTRFLLDFFEINNKILFTALDNGLYELWTTDGTTSGTNLLVDIVSINQPNALSSLPRHFARFGSHIYFAAHRDAELWRTDGTSQGTEYLTNFDIPNSGGNLYAIRSMIEINGELIISAKDYNGNIEASSLWKSDGTAGNRQLIADIPDIREPLYKAGNLVYFVGEDSLLGDEVWRSDGTTAGTYAIKDVFQDTTNFSGLEFDPQGLTALNNELIFFQDDGLHGRELWKTDGTSAGTGLVADIFTGSTSGVLYDYYYETAVMNNHVFFAARDDINGLELWKTDGTQSGTQIVLDIQAGLRGSFPHNLWVNDSTVFFAAYEASTGVELWSTDGTSDGTLRITDINPGKGNSNPAILGKVGDRLIFSADDGIHGKELWTLDITTGITKPLLNDPSFSAYPNPTTDELYISWKYPHAGSMDVWIKSIEGKIVARHRVDILTAPFDYSISVTSLPAGTYVLELVTNGTHLAQKFIKN